MRQHSIALAASLALGSTPLLLRADDSPTRDQLMQQIEQLRAKVEQLEAKQNTIASADVDQTVERVLRDAEKRSQLLAANGGLTAGFDKGRFFLRSDDGNYLLMPAFVFQTRYVLNYRDGADDGDDDDIQSGFEIRRMRLIFEGNAISPELTYKFQWETDKNAGNLFLQDAWAKYQFADQLAVQVGQFKDGVHHEEVLVDQYQLTADRSLVNALIGGTNIDRMQGVALIYDDKEAIRGNVMLHDGANTKNTDFTDSGGGSALLGVTDMNWGASARVEYKAMGDWKQYADFTAMGNTTDLLVVGAGANWSQSGDTDLLFHTADVQYENAGGLGLYGAALGLWRNIEAVAGDDDDLYDWGVLVQAGYMVHEKCEVFARYDYTGLDEDGLAAGAEEDIHEVTVGTNYYWHGQAAKFTIDLTWLPNGVPSNIGGLNLLAADDTEIILRGQFQLLL